MKEESPMRLKKMITVLSPSFALTSIVALSPAIASIAQAFPDTSISAVQSLTTLPSLVAIVVILLAGRLSSVVTKKRIVAFSVGLMILGGLLPLVFHQHFWQLTTAGVIFGLGYGGISPLTTALIHEHYSQEEQPTLLGFQSAVIGIGGVLFSYIGGQLAALCWWYAYGAFALFIPILVLVLMLPKGELSPPVKSVEGGGLWNSYLLFYVAQSILFAVFFYIFQTNLALLVTQRGLGGSQLSGRILSCQSAVGIVSGILGGRVLGRLREFSLPTILACTGIAQLVVYFSRSTLPLFFAAALIGFFFSIRMPAGYLKATSSVAPAAATLAISIYCSSSQVGQFLSPLAINSLGELLQLDLERKFLMGGGCLLVLALLSVLWELRCKKRCGGGEGKTDPDPRKSAEREPA